MSHGWNGNLTAALLALDLVPTGKPTRPARSVNRPGSGEVLNERGNLATTSEERDLILSSVVSQVFASLQCIHRSVPATPEAWPRWPGQPARPVTARRTPIQHLDLLAPRTLETSCRCCSRRGRPLNLGLLRVSCLVEQA